MSFLAQCGRRRIRQWLPRAVPAGGRGAASRSKATQGSVSDRIAQRVAERDSWPTWKSNSLSDVVKFISEKPAPLPSQATLDELFPVLTPDYAALAAPPADGIQVTWLGHASVLVQMHGMNVLTDPVFSERCSPFQWAGPKRFRRSACTVEDLKKNGIWIDICLISHNHYDHLDFETVHQLHQAFEPKFIVPLGLRPWFESDVLALHPAGGGFLETDSIQLDELDWWESTHAGTSEKRTGSCVDDNETSSSIVRITSIPMQHWSNRFGWDRDATLWCGYVIETALNSPTDNTSDKKNNNEIDDISQRFLFTGDTGWFPGLESLAQHFGGSFDAAAIPIGAYTPRDFLQPQHMDPTDGIRMFKTVNAQMGLPIHWGTFPLTHEPVLEPRERLIVRFCVFVDLYRLGS